MPETQFWSTALATDVVSRGLRDVLPKDAPTLCTLKSAKWIGSGRRREAVGNVTMFDGRPARVAIGVHEMGGCFGWTMRWLALDGGYSLEGDAWIRVDDDVAATPDTTGASE